MAGEWHTASLGSLLKGGIRHGLYKPLEAFGAGSRVLKMGLQYSEDRIGPQAMPRVPVTDEELTRFRVQEGDLLFSRTSMMSDGAGKCSLVVAHEEPFVFDGNILCGTPDRETADPAYIFYFLKSPAGKQSISEIIGGTQSRSLSGTSLSAVEVQLPPLDEQHAIAHILGTLDDKIELNRRMSETLEAMARAIFKSWFVDFDPVRAKAEGRDPGLPKHIADLFPDSFEDSELGEIPRGWRVGTLGDVAEHPRRGVQSNRLAPDAPYIGLEHMPRRSIALWEWDVADGLESNKFEFRKGEILFGKLRPYFHKVGVAPVDGVCSTDIVVVSPRTPQWFAFVLGILSSDEFVEHTNGSSTGTKMPRTSWTEMARYNIALAPDPVARAFTNLLQPVTDRINAGIHESRSAVTLRDTLLPKLISGELRIRSERKFIEVSG